MAIFDAARVRAALPEALAAAKAPKGARFRALLEKRLFAAPAPRSFETFATRALSGGFEKGLDPNTVALVLHLLARSVLPTSKKVTTFDELWLTPAAESDSEDETPGVLFHHGDLVIEGELGVDEGAFLVVTGKLSVGTLAGDDGLIVTTGLTAAKRTAGKGVTVLEVPGEPGPAKRTGVGARRAR